MLNRETMICLFLLSLVFVYVALVSIVYQFVGVLLLLDLNLLRFFMNCVIVQEWAAFRFEESTSQFGPSNLIETENLNSPSWPALTANERLPGAVLLARARLRERLRGLPPSGSRSVFHHIAFQVIFM